YNNAKWNTQPIHWSYNPAGAPAGLASDQVLSAMTSGFAQWQNVTSQLSIIYDGQTTSPPSFLTAGSGDGKNVQGLVTNLPKGVLGQAVCALQLTATSGSRVECDIGYNANLQSDSGINWTLGTLSPSLMDLVTTVLHEEGHFLGMGHSWNFPGTDCLTFSNG